MAVIKNQFTLRLNIETHAKLKKMAEHESRSITNMLEYIVKNEIARFEEKYGEIQLSDDDLYNGK